MQAPPSQTQLEPLERPELVIGLAGPIGVDMDLLSRAVGSALQDNGYTHEHIKLTQDMHEFPIVRPDLVRELEQYKGNDTFTAYMRKMSEANALRKQFDDPAVLARIAIRSIRFKREYVTGEPDIVRSSHAYVVRQFKRQEEVVLLRQVYGRQFIFVSAYATSDYRREHLFNSMKQELSVETKPIKLKYQADQLMDRDAVEDTDDYGQQLRDTFYLADVFVDGANKSDLDAKLSRFFGAMFGRNEISPSKDEYGMYAAKSASLRSADLSRQVGAAIFTNDGELITQGCNEVPKAFGGTYWDLETPDFRDIKKGYDPNERHKREILREVIERFRDRGFLSAELLKLGSDSQIVDALIVKRKAPDQNGALVGSRILDLTEYGRVVHAEMLALCDASRLGRSVRGAILYCTTFPCHNCTKHLLASGIRKVVYLEPYPKSLARELHPDEVSLEVDDDTKLSFVPFMGISPLRYRDLFQKGRRKREDGTASEWYFGVRRPMLDIVFPSYVDNESWAAGSLRGYVRPASPAVR